MIVTTDERCDEMSVNYNTNEGLRPTQNNAGEIKWYLQM